MPVELTPSTMGHTRRQTRIGSQAHAGVTGLASKAKAALRSKTVKPSLAVEPLPGTAMTTVAKPNQPGVLQTTQLTVTGGMASNTKTVDCLVIGSGPASLGVMVAAVKNQRLNEFIQDDGVAILDAGISFGGGMLCNYGINSNTSANSFLKCIFRKVKNEKPSALLEQLA